MDSKLIKATASSIVLGAALMGCTTSNPLSRPLAASTGAAANYRSAAQAQERAKKAVQQGDLTAAITAMEQAVEASPQDAGFRKTLAELYMKTGRFVSAEATYGDVVKLNPGDSKAGFFLALSQLAQGRTAAALVQLGAMDADVDASDLGLAYALAGQTQRALSLLEPAARDLKATGRDRQNLALAYALAGDWKRARITAAQDVSPSELNKRLQQWAALASVPQPESRVATLLGVSPANDPGQPTRLALAPSAPQAPASAEATVPVPTPAAPAAEVVSAVAAAPVPAAVPTSAPAYAASIAAPAPTIATIPAAPASPQPGFRPQRAALPTARIQLRKAASSAFVVQIGAFRTADQVQRAWNDLVRRYAFIGNYAPLSTSVTISGRGVFQRLSIAGFDSNAAAIGACRTIKAHGGSCFVRATAGDTPVQWASRTARKA